MQKVFLGEPNTAVFNAETGRVVGRFNSAGELNEDSLFMKERECIASRLEKRYPIGIEQVIYVSDNMGCEGEDAKITVRGDNFFAVKMASNGKVTYYLLPGTYTCEGDFLGSHTEPQSFTVEEDGSTEYVEIYFEIEEI